MLTPTPRICFGPVCNLFTNNTTNESILGSIGTTFARIITLFLTIGAVAMLLYLMWGAWDYLSSHGEKEKISKAQSKMTTAIIGMILMIVALSIFGYLAGDILGVIRKTDEGWVFTFPQLVNPPVPTP